MGEAWGEAWREKPAATSGADEPAGARERVDLTGVRRTLLVIATLGTMPASLVHALEREFPWLAVEQLESAEAAWRAFSQPVSLILIDASVLRKAREFVAQLPEWHPSSITALMEYDDRRTTPPQPFPDLDVIQGVLPMNLRLDIWLSVVRLMLRGGEYFPLSLLQPRLSRQPARNRLPGQTFASHALAAGPGAARSIKLFDLTRREMQVLEMVSQGAQNKTIAAAFDLSEHTVKIHVHNIINKMGTNNRTEAAARFRDYCQLPTELDAE